MHTQLPLTGVDLPPPPRAIANFFLALQPDGHAAANAAKVTEKLRRQQRLSGLAFQQNRFHISLLGFGNLDISISRVIAFANKIAALVRVPTFDIRFDSVMSFCGRSQKAHRHPIVLVGDGTHGVENLLQAQLDALNKIGISTTTRKFTPHMTLLYDEKPVAKQTVESIHWVAHEFVLIQSHIGQNRPYTVLGRWPLLG